jgi:ribosome assembly protein RRB1
MSKRAAETDEYSAALKAGDRPMADAIPDEAGEFEDEFEDEFESEDEILEAGVDGRPDAEREEEEKGKICELQVNWYMAALLTLNRGYGCRQADLHSWSDKTGTRRDALPRSVYL